MMMIDDDHDDHDHDEHGDHVIISTRGGRSGQALTPNPSQILHNDDGDDDDDDDDINDATLSTSKDRAGRPLISMLRHINIPQDNDDDGGDEEEEENYEEEEEEDEEEEEKDMINNAATLPTRNRQAGQTEQLASRSRIYTTRQRTMTMTVTTMTILTTVVVMT